ncbi:hypothetical protein V8D89_012043 [Ganoderma adspersum]
MKLPVALRLVSALVSLAAASRLGLPPPGLFFGVSALDINADRMALERRYTTPHSLGDNYVFDSRDGWQTVNTTNLLYKYQPRAITKHIGYDSEPDEDPDSGDTPLDSDAGQEIRGYTHGTGGVNVSPPATNSTRRMKRLVRRAKNSQSRSKAHKAKSRSNSTTKAKSKKPTSHKNAKKGKALLDGASTQTGLLGSFRKVLQSIKPVGKPEPDKSFAAALTLVGWESKPECFKFLECCAEGSKHVDLTKAAFGNLADLDEGLLTVQMRQATDPMDGWLEELWGPKMTENH